MTDSAPRTAAIVNRGCKVNQAEVDVVNARFDYLRAKAELEALIGRNL